MIEKLIKKYDDKLTAINNTIEANKATIDYKTLELLNQFKFYAEGVVFDLNTLKVNLHVEKTLIKHCPNFHNNDEVKLDDDFIKALDELFLSKNQIPEDYKF